MVKEKIINVFKKSFNLSFIIFYGAIIFGGYIGYLRSTELLISLLMGYVIFALNYLAIYIEQYCDGPKYGLDKLSYLLYGLSIYITSIVNNEILEIVVKHDIQKGLFVASLLLPMTYCIHYKIFKIR
jgi:hypothetical protein